MRLAPRATRVAHGCKTVNAFICMQDRKSTRLNSSHQIISYAVFCLKKKNKVDVKGTLGEYRATGQILFTCVDLNKGGHLHHDEFQTCRRSDPQHGIRHNSAIPSLQP